MHFRRLRDIVAVCLAFACISCFAQTTSPLTPPWPQTPPPFPLPQAAPSDPEPTLSHNATWGEQYHGLAFTVQLIRDTYRIGEHGEHIDAATWLTNFGTKPVEFSVTGPDSDHRYALFYADGHPVPPSKFAREVEEHLRTDPIIITRNFPVTLKPGEIQRGDSINDIQRWFDITESGTYTLIVMRSVPGFWNGFIVSNPITLQITGGKAPSTTGTAPAWGNPTNGLVLSLTVGEPVAGAINCHLRLKNVGDDVKTIFSTTFPRFFHLALFDAAGNAVPKTQRTLDAEDETLPRDEQGGIDKLAPDKTLDDDFNLRDFFQITKGGTYRLMVMRREDSWFKGFAVSNMVTFTVH